MRTVTYVNDHDEICPKSEATYRRVTLEEHVGGGCYSLLDEWHEPINPHLHRHHPDPVQAAADAGDEKYHELKELDR